MAVIFLTMAVIFLTQYLFSVLTLTILCYRTVFSAQIMRLNRIHSRNPDLEPFNQSYYRFVTLLCALILKMIELPNSCHLTLSSALNSVLQNTQSLP